MKISIDGKMKMSHNCKIYLKTTNCFTVHYLFYGECSYKLLTLFHSNLQKYPVLPIVKMIDTIRL